MTHRLPIILSSWLAFGLLLVWGRGVWAQTQAVANTGPSGTQLEQALQRGVQYFTARGLKVKRPDVTMLLDILSRHFDYPLSPYDAQAYVKAHPELQNSFFRCYQTSYADKETIEAYPYDQAIQYFTTNVRNMDARTAWSMYCRQFPLPDDFVIILHQQADIGGYELTHVALQYQSARYNGCLDGTTDLEKSLEAKLLNGLQAIAQTAPPKTPDNDIRLEAVAMLYYMQRPDLVQPQWLEWALAAQHPDGGWSEFSADTLSGDHASILGLWVLLAYRQYTLAHR